MQHVALDQRGFATPLTPISSQGMMRLGKDIESKANRILNGLQAFDRMAFSAPTEVTVSVSHTLSAPTLTFHTVKAQSGTSDYVLNVAARNNTFLVLKAKTGHTIGLQHGTSNIFVPGGANVALSGAKLALLYCRDSIWSVIGVTAPQKNASATSDPTPSDDINAGYSVDSLWINTSKDRIWICVDASGGAAVWKWISPKLNEFSVRAAAATLASIGIVTPTLVAGGGAANANDATDDYVRPTSSSGSANMIGFVTASFDLVQPSHDPVFEARIQTEATSLAGRFWIGLCSAAPTNVDTLAAGTKFIGFRYSQSAGDSGWRPVLNNGTSQSNGSAIVSMEFSTVYQFKIRVDSANARAYVSINNGAETLISTDFPASTTDMGIVVERWDGNGLGSLYFDFATAEVGW